MVLGLVALLITIAFAAGGLVAMLAAHRRAEAAADLAALAGAEAIGTGQDPCGVAGEIARLNDSLMQTCEVRGGEVWVVIRSDLPAVLGGRMVRARARAGPTS